MSTAILPGTAAPEVVRGTRAASLLAPATPESSAQVSSALSEYLARRWHVPLQGYARAPAANPNGWETYTYEFQLLPSPQLPASYQRPLILRVYSSPQGLSRAQREFAAQQKLRRLGYPAAEPLLLEESSHLFGGPFLVMEEVSGELFPEFMLHRPWRIWDLPAKMAECHARLHRLPLDGFPAPAEPFLDRRLDEVRTLIREHALEGLLAG